MGCSFFVSNVLRLHHLWCLERKKKKGEKLQSLSIISTINAAVKKPLRMINYMHVFSSVLTLH
jgi:hypothetical protein